MEIKEFKIDGGVTLSNFLVKFQANLLQQNLSEELYSHHIYNFYLIVRSKITNGAGFGAAILAAYHAKIFRSFDDIQYFFISENIVPYDSYKKKEYDGYYGR